MVPKLATATIEPCHISDRFNAKTETWQTCEIVRRKQACTVQHCTAPHTLQKM
eukprot:m.283959 g.283959  ORF g.283959 m.283959 type:complete len:53 (+) comp27013_c1_seq2:716-874(+)